DDRGEGLREHQDPHRSSRLIGGDVTRAADWQNRRVPAPAGKDAASPPPISVVVCAYTLERIDLIAAAIESLRAQTAPPHEIVLVCDHAPELEAECKRRWPELTVVP